MDSLPTFINPQRLAENRAKIHGQVLVAELNRLNELLADNSGIVTVDLKFGKDEQKFIYITGILQTTLHLQCQRCLQIMEYSIETTVSLSPVANDAVNKDLPDQYEPLLLEEEQISLLALVEDELLLNLPMIPKHEDINCATVL